VLYFVPLWLCPNDLKIPLPTEKTEYHLLLLTELSIGLLRIIRTSKITFTVCKYLLIFRVVCRSPRNKTRHLYWKNKAIFIELKTFSDCNYNFKLVTTIVTKNRVTFQIERYSVPRLFVDQSARKWLILRILWVGFPDRAVQKPWIFCFLRTTRSYQVWARCQFPREYPCWRDNIYRTLLTKTVGSNICDIKHHQNFKSVITCKLCSKSW